MFVIADLEWVTYNNNRLYPTQLAACRVDERWNALSEFGSFICPLAGERFDRKKMAYTGGSEQEYLCAPTAKTVFLEFESRLSDDDIIVWWHEDSMELFGELAKAFLNSGDAHKAVCAGKHVRAFLSGTSKSCGDMYKIAAKCKAISSANSAFKHYSPNDVIVFRKLMAALKFPQDELLKAPPERKKQPRLKPQTNAGSQYRFLYDIKTNTIHKNACAKLLDGQTATIGYPSLKTALRKGYAPCDCCKPEYKAAWRVKNIDSISRMTWNYIYSPESSVFHKRGCGVMYSAKRILGARSYAAVIKTGRRPCKLCRPTAEDEAVLSSQKRARPPKPGATLSRPLSHSLSKEEKRAIERQRFAIAERKRLLSSLESRPKKTVSEQERNDIYTLTHPGYAFFAAEGCRSFHAFGCPKLMRGATMLRGFSTYSEAAAAGHAPCKKCKPSAKQDVKFSIPITSKLRGKESVRDIEELCCRKGLLYYFEKAVLCVETPVGKWRIDTSRIPIGLMHINLARTPGCKKYHVQPRLFLSIKDAVKYIARHDSELENNPPEKHRIILNRL